jgi:hypothetical protein
MKKHRTKDLTYPVTDSHNEILDLISCISKITPVYSSAITGSLTTKQTPGSRIFLRCRAQPLTASEGLPSRSQESAPGPCPKPMQSTQHTPTPYLFRPGDKFWVLAVGGNNPSSENHTKHVTTLCRQNDICMKASGTQNIHCALTVEIWLQIMNWISLSSYNTEIWLKIAKWSTLTVATGFPSSLLPNNIVTINTQLTDSIQHLKNV